MIEKIFANKKIIFAIGLVFLILIFSRVFFWKKEPKIKTTKVKKDNLTLIVSASGKTKSQNQVDLKFQTSGKLAWVGVKEGENVKKWQAIASLDKEQLKKDLQKDLNDYMNERWDFEQTQEDYQQTKERLLVTDAIKRILEKAQFDLNNAVIDVELADLAVRLATLASPIEGIVTHIDTPIAGVNITPATAVFTIADPNSVIFVVNVDEADVSQISLGLRAKIALDAYSDQVFEGQVSKISFSAITTTGGGTAFPVEITLPENSDLRFKVGMNGDTEIVTQEKENVLVIPTSSVFIREDKNFVWKVVGGVAKKQEVKIGLEVEDLVEVIDGLTEGEKVISEDTSKIKEGQKVK